MIALGKLKNYMKYLYFTICLASLLSCSAPPETTRLLRHVGDIVYDPAIDDSDFEPCNAERAYQYYNFSNAIQYDGEKAAIRRIFEKQYQPIEGAENGYVSIRFMVNCEGVSGWFRTTEMDQYYQPKSLNPKITSQLLEITKSLDGWKVGINSRDRKRDYYQYLTFKITNGTIEDIMP